MNTYGKRNEARPVKIRQADSRRILVSVRWGILGVVLGILLSVVSGVYIIYADMMSRVTTYNPEQDQAIYAPNLLELGQYQPEDPPVDPGPGENNEPDVTDPTSGMPLPSENDDPSPTDNFIPAPVRPMNGIENILLFGVDSRGNNYRGRSDVIILVSFNHTTRKISLVSLFRAIEVKIPGYREPTLLNAAYAFGGPRLAVKTVESTFGIPISGFITFNFGSLVNLVDAVGGISITLSNAEARSLNMTPGTHYLTGWSALNYSRLRKIDTDFHRNQRQRNVIEAIIDRISNGGVRTLYNAATVILANCSTNLNLSDYVANATELLKYRRQQTQVPIWYGPNREAKSAHNKYGQEVWPLFNRQATANRIYNFITN